MSRIPEARETFIPTKSRFKDQVNAWNAAHRPGGWYLNFDRLIDNKVWLVSVNRDQKVAEMLHSEARGCWTVLGSLDFQTFKEAADSLLQSQQKGT